MDKERIGLLDNNTAHTFASVAKRALPALIVIAMVLLLGACSSTGTSSPSVQAQKEDPSSPPPEPEPTVNPEPELAIESDSPSDGDSEWHRTYAKIIDLLPVWSESGKIAFIGLIPGDVDNTTGGNYGGASEGYTLNSAKLTYFLRDISGDGIPELFIGAQTSGEPKIVAIYTFRNSSHNATLVESYSREIYLCENDTLLLRNSINGDELMVLEIDSTNMYSGAGVLERYGGFEGYRSSIISAGDLGWQPIDKWQ